MTFELRYYQKQAVDAIIQHIEVSDDPCLVVLPTGAGKSLIPATLANYYFQKKILILQPSVELLGQNLAKLSPYCQDITVNSASTGLSRSSSGRVVFATIGSIFKSLVQFDIIIIDEAHYLAKDGQYQQFLKNQKAAKVVGLTATPFRNERIYGDVRRVPIYGIRSFFTLVYTYQIKDIISDGFWSPYHYHDMEFDSRGLVSTGVEYTSDSVAKVLASQNVLHNFLRHYRNSSSYSDFTPTLVFCPSIKVCQHIDNFFAGDCAFVHGKLDVASRRRLIAQILKGQKRLILNVGTLVTGFDYPSLGNVYFLDPTGSLTRYYQMFGRAIRPFPNKTTNYYDMVGNRVRLGDISNLHIS